MSRIGKKPVPIPPGVTVEAVDGTVTVTGKRGTLTQRLAEGIRVEVSGGEAVVRADGEGMKSLHGLYRSLLANMVRGVTEGFTRTLEIVGVGYKAEARPGALHFSLGYSHPVVFPLPEGVTAEVEGGTVVRVTGADKELVGRTAARIRALRKPDVYKQKGIRYRGERLLKKVGKTAGK